MRKRSPIAVLLLNIVTVGIYHLIWYLQTTTELRSLGYDVPTRWLLIIPLANIYWLWCYCQAVEEVTNGRNSQVVYFIVFMLLGPIAQSIVQNDFNRIAPLLTTSFGGDGDNGGDIKITVERVG